MPNLEKGAEMKMYCNQNIKALLGNDGDPASYCCDEAWYSKEFPEDYESVGTPSSHCKYIEMACKAIENGAEYGTAEGPLQREMYEMLFAAAGSTKEERELLRSKDRMTNFGYTFKIVLKVMRKLDSADIVDLGWSSFGQSKPPYSSFHSKGFDDFQREFIEPLAEMPNSRKDDTWQKAIEELNDFARHSSTLGNYCCMPSGLPSLEITRLNSLKGGIGTNPFVLDGKSQYRINDQFALFTEWVDAREEQLSENDRSLIRTWKRVMLLENMWGTYREAASVYKDMFRETNRTTRLDAMRTYLSLVNKAIKDRGDEMVRRLK